MSQAPAGLINQILAGTPLAGLGIKPELVGKDIVIRLNEEQFKNIAFAKADERAKQLIQIKIHEGYIEVRIKLF
ncbi:MAG: hypothetical protein B6U97_03480 [Candidatus Altiarchaeales archaeon ex4484_96]|nr:MAG: hypothetical protein B6U97_03480 [Candidatus Altiarchaeales archaeon ex4484_96]